MANVVLYTIQPYILPVIHELVLDPPACTHDFYTLLHQALSAHQQNILVVALASSCRLLSYSLCKLLIKRPQSCHELCLFPLRVLHVQFCCQVSLCRSQTFSTLDKQCNTTGLASFRCNR